MGHDSQHEDDELRESIECIQEDLGNENGKGEQGNYRSTKKDMSSFGVSECLVVWVKVDGCIFKVIFQSCSHSDDKEKFSTKVWVVVDERSIRINEFVVSLNNLKSLEHRCHQVLTISSTFSYGTATNNNLRA